jgi:hypothetical protein
MIKKKMLAIGMGCLISMASIVPAFALENVVKDPIVKQVKIEAKQAETLLKLQERAAKLGISIEGLSLQEAKEKIEVAFNTRRSERAVKLGIDISNLSKEAAKAKIKEAATIKKEARNVKLNEIATKLGVDISGLTNKEAAAKIKEAKASKQATKAEKKVVKASNN